MAVATPAVKLFISYAHKDEPYFKVFDEGLKEVLQNSNNFEWSIWNDKKIHVGNFWDETIQSNIQDCDVALLLVSVAFMASNYIREKEYNEFVKRYAAKNILIVPVVFAPCDFATWNDLSQLQFFKPDGADYDKATITNFTYADLIKFRETDGTIIPNPNINRYHLNLVKKIETSFTDFLNRTVAFKSETMLPIVNKKLSDAPKPKTYFTGREKELEEFRKTIEQKVNLITIDGPGGIGKTQFISRCIEKFVPADKIIWYDCTSASQLDTLISEAGYPELLVGSNKSDRDKFSAFKDKIQAKELYLFLDNFQETNNNPVFKEFLLFIQGYLKAGSVIVIDRDDIRTVELTPKRIHLEGFKEKRLEYAKALIEYSYENEINIGNDKLDELCAQLHGYPLAIDFAINLLSQGVTHDDILAKIVNETEVYQISERLLNAIFERPDATEEERDFMRQFSVFTGSVSEAAVAAVISEAVFKPATRKLQKKNLLTYAQGQYSIHPLVREFCYKELKYKVEMHAKAADYYVEQRSGLNPALEEMIFYHLSQSEQWGRIEAEIEKNGRQLIMSGQLGLLWELLDKLKKTGIVKPVFHILYGDVAEVQGKWNEAQEHYDRARQQETDINVKAEGLVKYGEMIHRKEDAQKALTFYEEAHKFSLKNNLKREEARALNDIGLVLDLFGDLDNALKKITEALDIRKIINDKQGIATSLGNIANIYDTQGNIFKALEFYQGALKIGEEIANKQGIASSLGNIGNIYNDQGETSKALDYFQRSLKLQEDIGNKQGISVSLCNIANIYVTKGETSRALEYYERSLNLNEEIGNKYGIPVSLNSIGDIYANRGEISKALEHYEHSLRINQEMGNKQGTSASLSRIGNIYKTQGNISKALEFHEHCLMLNEKIGNKRGISFSLGNIGGIYKAKGDNKIALEYYQRSLKLVEEIGNKPGIATMLGNIGSIYDSKGDSNKALEYHQRSLKLEEEIGNKQGISASLCGIGSIYDNLDETAKALQYYQRSLNIDEEIDNKHGIAVALGNMGVVYQKMKNFTEALTLQKRALSINTAIGDKREVAVTLLNIGVIYAESSVKDYPLALESLFHSLSLLNVIDAKLDSIQSTRWIIDIREKVGLPRFKTLALVAFGKLSPELQKHIPLNELIQEPVHRDEKVGRNDSCPCGSGKKYKNCCRRGV